MRVDGKPQGLRQSMAWLHTWSGLLLGWLLYAIFFTGTLSYFVDEINDWMRPELHRSTRSDQTVELAIQRMEKLAPGAAQWTLDLPGARHVAVEASWRMPGAPAGRQGVQHADIDAATGRVLHPRETAGGNFLYRFHFQLYAIPRTWGQWIVGTATMFMLVAILSGVITHKKIFTEFFTFRPGKGQRSWLDAHNMMAVLALPFHLTITFSGLLLLMSVVMPWGAQALYGDGAERFATAFRIGTLGERPPAPQGGRSAPTEHPPIAPLLAQAQRVWPERGAGRLTIIAPGTSQAVIELREQGSNTLAERESSERLRFDGTTGAPLAQQAPQPSTPVMSIYNVMRNAHVGRFADPVLRWLLFLSGVVGTAMAAAGMVLWVVKRQPQRPASGRIPAGHRFVEVMNVAAIAGLPVATAVYFWSNRLIPLDIAGRAPAEIHCFFWAWGVCLVHAALRPYRLAWREQMTVSALAFSLLPVLNWLTGGTPLAAAIAREQWSIAGFDLAALSLAAIQGYIAQRLYRARARSLHPARDVSASPTTSSKQVTQ